MNKEQLHFKLSMALTAYDRKQSTRKDYNHYALGIYFQAVERVEAMREEGKTVRESLVACFNGRLLDVVLKAVGEAKSTDEEQRGRL